VGVVLARLGRAMVSHFRSWSCLVEVGASAVTVYLIRRNLPDIQADPEPAKTVALYVCVLALCVSALVSHRRANGVRSEGSWVDLRREEHHAALLAAEYVWCLILTLVLCVPPLVYAAMVDPSLVVVSVGWILTLAAVVVMIAAATAAVFYVLSAFVLGTEAWAIVAAAIVVMGFSRSDVPREVARGLGFLGAPAAEAIGHVIGVTVRVLTPPIEETIKAGLVGSFEGSALFIAQLLLQTAFALCLSAYVVSRWGPYSLAERREVAQQASAEKAGSTAGGAGA